MRYFCTYFDSNYLLKGLALYNSIKRHVKEFKIWVLCLDPHCFEIMKKLELSNVSLIDLSEFESVDKTLLEAKKNRSILEYYFTLSPALPLFLLNTYKEIDIINYTDADLYFYKDPTPIFEEFGDKSILIIEHKFPDHQSHRLKFGIFNVGLLAFRRDDNSFRCLEDWKKACLDCCTNITENNKFADQKYLDNWPEKYEMVHILKHKGANLAPWNLGRFNISKNEAEIFVDGEPLIFFHFHAFRFLKAWLIDPGLRAYGVSANRLLLKSIYKPYIKEQKGCKNLLESRGLKIILNKNLKSPLKHYSKKDIIKLISKKKLILKIGDLLI